MWRLSVHGPFATGRRGIPGILGVVAAILVGLLAGPAAARAQWVEVGSRSFALIGGTVSISVTRNEPIRGLRLVNRGAPMVVTGIRVIYRDRSTFTERRHFRLATGERTRVFAVLSRGKAVSSVVVMHSASATPSAGGRLAVLGNIDAAPAARRPDIATAPPLPQARPAPKADDAIRQQTERQRLEEALKRRQAERQRSLDAARADAMRKLAEARERMAAEQQQQKSASRDDERLIAEARARAAAEAQARARADAERQARTPAGETMQESTASGRGAAKKKAARPKIVMPTTPPPGSPREGAPAAPPQFESADRSMPAKPPVGGGISGGSYGTRGTGVGGGGSGTGGGQIALGRRTTPSFGTAPPAPMAPRSLERGASPPPAALAPPSPPIVMAPAPIAPSTPPPAAGGEPRARSMERSTQPPAAAAAPEPAAPAAPEPQPAASATANADWDVVPVYYGTDRAKETDPKRIQFGSTRGKRLELGRALVTVPKTHQVPNVERPWALTIPYLNITLYQEKEDPKRHFTMKEIRGMTRDELLALVRERLAKSVDYKDHAFVFVHGFNNTFDNAIYRTAQIAYDLKFDGAPFSYSWPSKGALGATDYSYDRESAGSAEPYFRDFLDMVVKETGAKQVSIIAHSMGNQLLLTTLRSLKPSLPDGVKLNQIILAAPDVDRDAFEFLAKEIMGISRGMTLLAAGNDRALEVSRRFWGGVPRAGDVPETGPVVVQGIDTIDITATSTAMFALNHSGYAEKTAVIEDLSELIHRGTRPPNVRMPTLESVTTPKGPYWRWPIQ